MYPLTMSIKPEISNKKATEKSSNICEQGFKSSQRESLKGN